MPLSPKPPGTRIASEFLQSSSVSSGKGTPLAIKALPPTRPFVKVNLWLNFFSMALRTLTPCSQTSGPIPSPPKTAIFNFIRYKLGS